MAPEKPNTKTFDELVNVLQRHYKPKPQIIAERFRCYKRQQQDGETLASFSVALRQLSSSCEFGAFLPEALRDQFVWGLSNQGIQRKLLAEANLTLDRALQLATAMSMATENTVEFHTDTLRRDTHTVNKVSRNVQAKRMLRAVVMGVGDVLSPTIHLMFVGLKRQFVIAVNRKGIYSGRVRNENTQAFHSKVRHAML